VQGLILNGSGVLGNAPRASRRLSSARGLCLWGYPDLDALFGQQAVEGQPGRRETVLHQMQRAHAGARHARPDL